jgi:hypothetical protein
MAMEAANARSDGGLRPGHEQLVLGKRSTSILKKGIVPPRHALSIIAPIQCDEHTTRPPRLTTQAQTAARRSRRWRRRPQRHPR